MFDRRSLTFASIGTIAGAFIIGSVWAASSWQPEPSFRHTADYDLCRAHDRSVEACDASLRLMTAQRERDACLAKAGTNPFAVMDCEDGFRPAVRRQ